LFRTVFPLQIPVVPVYSPRIQLAILAFGHIAFDGVDDFLREVGAGLVDVIALVLPLRYHAV